jgi:UDP-N-acetylglucosamine:LPS N-acetylglucosamine transferase
MPASRRLEFVYFDAGGGHRSAALALKETLSVHRPDWQVDLVNLQEILKPVDPVYRLTDVYLSQDLYNGLLKRGWTYGLDTLLRLQQQAIKLYAKPIERELQKYWKETQPDLVVSLIPNFNRPMLHALRRVHPDTPYATIMTDIADCPPHFWQEKQDQFLICGSDIAMDQAHRAGYEPTQLFRASGMVLKPQFYASPELSVAKKRAAQRALGLDPDKPTALIMFGGYGASRAQLILKRLKKAKLGVQSIVLCGHNEKLRKSLARYPSCHAVGFTNDVPRYMQLADFFIGKPGPASISEALHMGLPVILERNAATMPQEYYTTVWVEEHGLGIVISSFARIAKAVKSLLDGNRLDQMRAQAKKLNNRAVFEIPDMLDDIMESAARTEIFAQKQA